MYTRNTELENPPIFLILRPLDTTKALNYHALIW